MGWRSGAGSDMTDCGDPKQSRVVPPGLSTPSPSSPSGVRDHSASAASNCSSAAADSCVHTPQRAHTGHTTEHKAQSTEQRAESREHRAHVNGGDDQHLKLCTTAAGTRRIRQTNTHIHEPAPRRRHCRPEAPCPQRHLILAAPTAALDDAGAACGTTPTADHRPAPLHPPRCCPQVPPLTAAVHHKGWRALAWRRGVHQHHPQPDQQWG